MKIWRRVVFCLILFVSGTLAVESGFYFVANISREHYKCELGAPKTATATESVLREAQQFTCETKNIYTLADGRFSVVAQTDAVNGQRMFSSALLTTSGNICIRSGSWLRAQFELPPEGVFPGYFSSIYLENPDIAGFNRTRLTLLRHDSSNPSSVTQSVSRGWGTHDANVVARVMKLCNGTCQAKTHQIDLKWLSNTVEMRLDGKISLSLSTATSHRSECLSVYIVVAVTDSATSSGGFAFTVHNISVFSMEREKSLSVPYAGDFVLARAGSALGGKWVRATRNMCWSALFLQKAAKQSIPRRTSCGCSNGVLSSEGFLCRARGEGSNLAYVPLMCCETAPVLKLKDANFTASDNIQEITDSNASDISACCAVWYSEATGTNSSNESTTSPPASSSRYTTTSALKLTSSLVVAVAVSLAIAWSVLRGYCTLFPNPAETNTSREEDKAVLCNGEAIPETLIPKGKPDGTLRLATAYYLAAKSLGRSVSVVYADEGLLRRLNRTRCLVRAIELYDSRCRYSLSECYLMLVRAVELEGNGTVLMGPHALTRFDLLVRCAELGVGYYELGCELGRTDSVRVGTATYSRIGCFEKAMLAGSGDAAYRLAQEMHERLRPPLNNRTTTASLYAKAIESHKTSTAHYSLAEAYFQLAVEIVESRVADVVVGDHPVGKLEALQLALNIEPLTASRAMEVGVLLNDSECVVVKTLGDADALFHFLRTTLPPDGTLSCNKLLLLIAALLAGESAARAHLTALMQRVPALHDTLGDLLLPSAFQFVTGMLLCTAHSARPCSASSSGSAGANVTSAFHCFADSIEWDQRSPSSHVLPLLWLYTAKEVAFAKTKLNSEELEALSVIAGAAYEHLFAEFEAPRVKRYGDEAEKWITRANGMEDNCKLAIGPLFFSKEDCLVEALKCNPRHPMTWLQLGLSMPLNQKRLLGSGMYGRLDCIIESLKYDRDCALAWKTLALYINPRETVMLQGEEYARVDCYAEALRLDPHDSETWGLVQQTLQYDDIIVTVNGQQCSPQAAIAEGFQFLSSPNTQEKTERKSFTESKSKRWAAVLLRTIDAAGLCRTRELSVTGDYLLRMSMTSSCSKSSLLPRASTPDEAFAAAHWKAICNSFVERNCSILRRNTPPQEWDGDAEPTQCAGVSPSQAWSKELPRFPCRTICDSYIVFNLPTNNFVFSYPNVRRLEEHATSFDVGGPLRILPEERVRLWMRDVLYGLHYLHNVIQVAHGNLQLSTLLVSSNAVVETVLLGDVHLCAQGPIVARADSLSSEKDSQSTEKVSQSSEKASLTTPGQSNEKSSDIFAFGCIFFQLLVGTGSTAFESVRQCVSQQALKIILDCVTGCAGDRPTVIELLRNPYFSDHENAVEDSADRRQRAMLRHDEMVNVRRHAPLRGNDMAQLFASASLASALLDRGFFFEADFCLRHLLILSPWPWASSTEPDLHFKSCTLLSRAKSGLESACKNAATLLPDGVQSSEVLLRLLHHTTMIEFNSIFSMRGAITKTVSANVTWRGPPTISTPSRSSDIPRSSSSGSNSLWVQLSHAFCMSLSCVLTIPISFPDQPTLNLSDVQREAKLFQFFCGIDADMFACNADYRRSVLTARLSCFVEKEFGLSVVIVQERQLPVLHRCVSDRQRCVLLMNLQAPETGFGKYVSVDDVSLAKVEAPLPSGPSSSNVALSPNSSTACTLCATTLNGIIPLQEKKGDTSSTRAGHGAYWELVRSSIHDDGCLLWPLVALIEPTQEQVEKGMVEVYVPCQSGFVVVPPTCPNETLTQTSDKPSVSEKVASPPSESADNV